MLIRHTIIYLFARGLPGLFAFAAIAVYTRLLKPEEYGRYSLVVAAVTLASALVFQWVRLALVRYAPAADLSRTLRPTLLALALALATASLVVGLPLALLDVQWRPLVVPSVVLLVLTAFFELFLESARADMRPGFYSTLLLSKSAIALAVGAGLARLGFGWWSPVVGLGIGLLFPTVLAYLREWRTTAPRFDPATLRRVCAYGLPLSFTVALVVVMGTTDRFIISALRGEDDAGLYAVGIDLTQFSITMLMMVVNLAAYPLAVRAYESHGPDAARAQLTQNFSLLLAVGLPAAAGLALLAGNVANVFVGPAFRETTTRLIPVAAAATFIAGLKSYYFDVAFQFRDKTISQVWIAFAAAAASVSFNFLLIPRFGLIGAAFASLLGWTFATCLAAVVGARYFSLPTPPLPIAQVALATAVMAAVILPVRPMRGQLAMVLQVGLGAFAYAAAMFVMNFHGARVRLLGRAKPVPIEPPVAAPVLEGRAC
jgi:O-antigen/teichoic acid export membrane protein